MNIYIGIDLGTSGVKCLLLSENGIEKTCLKEYSSMSPKEGYSEQNPYDWYEKTMEALEELLEGVDRSKVRAMSFSGQMHGLVLLDEKDEVIRPAILWNDGRSIEEVAYLNEIVGKDFLLSNTANIAFAGFTAPKLLWVKNHEPEKYFRINKIMLPKDYLAYRISGEFCTDVSDAAGTLYFDVKNRCWSKEMLNLLAVEEYQLPRILESWGLVGNVMPEVAKKLGLSEKTKIIIGAGDNAASAVGTGIISLGQCNISLGTSGTIFVESHDVNYDTESAIHMFASASGNYHYLACILSAASAQKWWLENILKTGYDMSGLESYMGKNQVYFLPYLAGERSPMNDVSVRGMFMGLSANTTREEMTLAVLEGVAFALKQNLDIIRKMGVGVRTSKICGGGAKNRLWLRILANVLNVTLELPENEQGGALGAALLAAKGSMCLKEFQIFAEQFYGVKETIEPEAELVQKYEKKFEKFIEIYPKIK